MLMVRGKVIGRMRRRSAAAVPPLPGGNEVIKNDANGVGIDFTYSNDEERVAVKTAGVIANSTINGFFQNLGTSAKLVYDVAGVLNFTPHNLVLQSENLQATWAITNATAVTATFARTTTAASVVHRISQSMSIGYGQVFTYQADVSAAGYNKIGFNITGGPAGEVAFDLSTGAIIYQNTAAAGWGPITIVPLGSGVYRITIVALLNTSGIFMYILSPSYTTGTVAAVWTADGVGGINVFRQQVNRGVIPCEYLKTTTATRSLVSFDHDPVTHAPVGLRVEGSTVNNCLWSNDFTQTAWVKSSATASFTASDPTGAPNQASIITATGANATVLQSITSASSLRMTSFFLRRRTGTGPIAITQDNGVTWTTVVPTAGYARFATLEQTLTNPVVGVRITTSGDAVDVWCGQSEGTTTSRSVTTPWPSFTAQLTRTGDNYQFLLSQIPPLGSSWSLFMRFSVPNAAQTTAAICITDGTANQQTRFHGSGGYLRQMTCDGGTNPYIWTNVLLPTNTLTSVAGRFAVGDCMNAEDGVIGVVGTGQPVAMPVPTMVTFGNLGLTTASSGFYIITKMSIVSGGWDDARLLSQSGVQ